MQDSIGWAVLHLSPRSICQDCPNVSTLYPQLSQILACLHAWHTAYAQAHTLSGRLGPSEPLSVKERSLCTSSVAGGQDWDWYSHCWPLLCDWDVPTSVQEHESALNMGKEKDGLAHCHPSRCFATASRLSIMLMCLAAPARPLSVDPWWGETLTELMPINMDWDSIASGLF